MTIFQVRQRSSELLAHGQNLLDKVISPSTRERAYSNIAAFAREKPLLAAFLAIQFVFSSLFLVIFACFVGSTIVFALGSALLFIAFWVGVALFLLLPTLFVTVSVGILVWMWAVSSFFIARWAYEMVPVSTKGNFGVEMPNGKTITVKKTGNGYGDVEAKVEEPVVI